MEITDAILRKSVAQKAFGSFEPFIGGDEHEVSAFYDSVLSALASNDTICVHRESDHHGSGYASYVSAFLFPSDGRSQRAFPNHIETGGILLYMSRLAPIAVFGASARTASIDGQSSSLGFIGVDNVGTPPDGDWEWFVETLQKLLQSFGIELLPRAPLLIPAPDDISIPTVFDGPYYILDALFYWED
jgi:hypothetical protein